MPDRSTGKTVYDEGESILGPATTLVIGVTLAAARPLMEDIYKHAKTKLARSMKECTAERLTKRLQKRAQDISLVKTLLCLEQSVLITEFYSPQYIKLSDERRIEVTSPDVFRDNVRMIITGVAGQGKSILFRYLALYEIARGKLPLFIELRNFENENSISTLLVSELATLGFPETEEVLTFLLDSGKCTLYLDAFDEVPPRMQGKARKQIEDIARKHPECRIYVSSRPTLNIESSAYFRVARLDDLAKHEAILALEKMCGENDSFETIKSELSQSNGRIARLLTTPLMVALLLLHHRLSGKFPETEQAFFGDLFDVLLRRHDQTKGYNRQRYSSASELELLELFSFLSYAVRRKGIVELPRPALLEVSAKGAEFFQRDYKADGALDDIVHGTNLILEEGAMCRFAHKAVQEFYAARFLAGQPESEIEKFLRHRIREWNVWQQLFEFVELINPLMFYRHFLVPHIGLIAFRDEKRRVSGDWKPSKNVYLDVFRDDLVAVADGGLVGVRFSFSSTFYGFRRDYELTRKLIHTLEAIDWTDVEAPEEIPADWELPFLHLKKVQVYPLAHLLKQPCGDQIRGDLQDHLKAQVLDAAKCYEYVDHRLGCSDFFD